MIHGGMNNPVNNLPLYVRSLTFGSDTQAVFRLGHWHLGPWSKVFCFPLWTTKAGLEILNSPLILLVLLVYIQNKEGNQVSQFPPGNFPKSGDLLLDRKRDLDLRRKQQRRPSYLRRLPLLRVVAFLDNVLEAAWWFKLVAPSAPLRLTLAAANLQQLQRTSC
jgi:hypothetical protein